MNHPGRLFLGRPWPSRAENRLTVANEFRLYEKITEGRVRQIMAGLRQHHFGVGGYFDDSAYLRMIRDADAPKFDIVFRRNADLGVSLDLIIPASELGAALREDRLVGF